MLPNCRNVSQGGCPDNGNTLQLTIVLCADDDPVDLERRPGGKMTAKLRICEESGDGSEKGHHGAVQE
jgi:hypothetical protein